MSEQEPAWKRHGRNGPFDWWLGCQQHGAELTSACMSCRFAIDHNHELQKRLDAEKQERP